MQRSWQTIAKLHGWVSHRAGFKTLDDGTVVARDIDGLGYVRFGGENNVNRNCQFRGDVGIGRRTTIGAGCTFHGQITIGKYCMFGPDTAVYAVNHPLTHLTTYTHRLLLGGLVDAYSLDEPVQIEHDVWTGRRALVLPGVQIGTGAVIGAGAVVTKSVEPYAIVAGNPAAVVGHRLDSELVPLLQSLSWWDMSDSQLETIRELFEMDLVADKVAALERLRGALSPR